MQNIVKNTDCTNHIKELWKVFTKDGKELFSYTIRGEGEDEEECTKQLLAYENHCYPIFLRKRALRMRWKEDFLRTIKTGLKFTALEHCMMGAIRLQFEINLAHICGMRYAVGALTGFLIYSRCAG